MEQCKDKTERNADSTCSDMKKNIPEKLSFSITFMYSTYSIKK
jgi:hypothetical protein